MKREGWIVAAAGTLFYLAFHSCYYNFDGVACAVAVDLGQCRYLTHGNHLLYGVAGWAFHRLWGALGYRGPALLALQTLDGLLGAATLGVLWTLLAELGVSRPARLAAAAGLAVSQAFWLWSLEAQVYPLGNLLALLCLREALKERPRPAVVGGWLGLACLGHVGNVMLSAAAAYGLWRRRRPGRERRDLVAAAGACAAVLAAAYAAAALLCVKPANLAEARVWLLGSAALTNGRSFTWYGGYSLRNWASWASMSLRLVADPSALAGWPRLAAYLASAAALGAALRGALVGAQRPLAKACLLWLAAYAALFASWQPFTIVYRVADLIPLWLLIALALERAGPPARLAALPAVLGLGLFNYGSVIKAACDPRSNAAYQEALWIAEATPPQAWIAATGMAQVYAPYFAHRRPLELRHFEGRDDELAARVAALQAAGEPVYVSDSALLDGWRPAFTRLGLTAVGERAGSTLYRVMTNGKPSGSRTKKLKTAAAERNGPNGIGSERLSRPRAISATP